VDSIHSLAVKNKEDGEKPLEENPASSGKDKEREGKDVERRGKQREGEEGGQQESGYDSCRQLADNAWPSLLVLSFVLGKAKHEVYSISPFSPPSLLSSTLHPPFSVSTSIPSPLSSLPSPLSPLPSPLSPLPSPLSPLPLPFPLSPLPSPLLNDLQGVIQLVLKTYQSFTEACGLLKLLTPQDALLTTLHKFSLPVFKCV
jgi:hypothetical protein